MIHVRESTRIKGIFTSPPSFDIVLGIMSVYNLEQIKALIPHRDPFLFIDEVVECDDVGKIVAVKKITRDEYYFAGHFPGNPIMPGVIQVETIAQTAGILSIQLALAQGHKVLPLLTSIEKTKFRKVVRPGDVLRIEAFLVQQRRLSGKFRGRILVDGKVTCETELMCTMIPEEGGKIN